MPSSARYTEMKHSGIEWVGNIPSHWSVKTLNQFVSQVKNKNSKLEEKNLLSLSYGKIKRKDINSSDGLLPASFDGYNIVEAGDIVLRLTDLQNDKTSLRVGLATERGIITSAYTTLRPFDVKQSNYLYYLLHSFDIKKGFYGMGSGVRQGLNYGEVKELRIALPLQNELEAIASYLDVKCAKIDDLISETKKSIEDYMRLKTSIVFEAVTKGINPAAEMRDSGVEWIGAMPTHWKLKKIKHATNMIGSGTTPDSNNPAYYDGEHFWIQSGDLYDCDVLTSTKRTITTLAVESSSALQFYENDFVVVAMYGASVGNAAISQISGYVNQACCVLVPDNDNDVRFLFYWFTACKNDLISQSLGGGQPNISQQKIKNEPYLQPPIDELQSIANYLDDKFFAINNIINTKKQLINSLSEYKQSLIYEVVTGKRKVCNP